MVTDFIRDMTFTPNDEDKLTLSHDRVTCLYRNESDIAFMTIEQFDLVSVELEDGSKEEKWKNGESFEDIRSAMIKMDFEQVARYFQSAIDEQTQKSKVLQKECLI